MQLTNDGLKKLAALSVATFNNEGIPLNDSLTKIALDNEMNSDQVKRMVETTNQLAYLSELDNSGDRTFEFNVANYDDIMDGIIPASGMDKSASESKGMSPMDTINSVYDPMTKVAQEKEATIEKWGRNQKLQALKKVAAQNRLLLDEMESAEHDNLVKLAQHRAIVSRDPEALLKMASFDNSKQMTRLVFGHEKFAEDVRRVWRPETLRDVEALSNRLTMCKQAQEDKAILKDKVEKAEALLKEAFVGAALNTARSMASSGAAKASSSPSMAKMKKAYGTFDAVDSTNEVRKGTKKNYDSWSSLRGK